MIISKNDRTAKQLTASKSEDGLKSIKPPFPEKIDDPYLTEHQTANLLNVSTKWLQKMRHEGGGIPYQKLGTRMVRYRMSEIRNYCDNCLKQNTSE